MSARSVRGRRSSTAGSARARRRHPSPSLSASGATPAGSPALLGGRQRAAEETIISEPILRRLSDHEQAMIGAADLFNALAVPPHGRRNRPVTRGPRSVSVVVPLRRQLRGRGHRRLGHLLVPVPRLPGVGHPGSPRGPRPRSLRSSRRRSRLECAYGRRRPRRPGYRAALSRCAGGSDEVPIVRP